MSRGAAARVTLHSVSADDTERIGAALAGLVRPGTVVGLVGPLGAGKTCLVRGLAKGLGIDPDLVSSPTFLYLVDYPGGVHPLNHADLYRLGDLPAGASERTYEELGLVAAFAGAGICVVEWWDLYRGAAPALLVRVEFVMENAEHRRLTVVFDAPDARENAAALALKVGTATATGSE